jgi:anti-sigma regulatory factor (Ser/Thr protein kinase)/DNA-binding NarL/FixJ family response regulator
MLASAQAALALRKTMLVVDPQQDIKNLLDGLVRVEGWNLKQAPDNQTAVSLVKESSFDLIITGQKTTGREDLELLQKVRRVRPHMRMIILTDRGTPEEVIAALCQNAFSYFRAPFDEGLMAHMVRTAMTQPCWDDGIEVISATPKWIRLLARCTQGTADRLIQFLREADIPFEEREDIALAAHEILLNAMEHGGHFDPNEYVEIGYLRTKRMVVCRVKDPGRGFSFEDLHHAAIHNPPDDLFAHMAVREEKGLRPGGFGILLASKLVDEIIYGQHGDDVMLIKYLDPLSGGKNWNWASSLPS